MLRGFAFLYIMIGMIYAIYSTFFDVVHKHMSFMYNLTRGMEWPLIIVKNIF